VCGFRPMEVRLERCEEEEEEKNRLITRNVWKT
jgi:hypothetical protein